jgi:hypothetical protein
MVPAGWVEPPECELEEHDEGARLTAGNDATPGRHSVNRDDAWDMGSDGDGYSSDESETERRRRERKKADQRKAKRERRQQGDVHDGSGRQLPEAERAMLDRTVL